MAKALKLEKAVDGHLKPVKDSDDSLTALEVSTDKVRAKNLDVADDLNVEGDIKSPVIDAPATGNLTLSPTNRVILDPHTGGTIYIQDAGTTYATFYTGASHSFLKMFENEGASEDDFLLIGVGANGATTLQTADAGGATAHLTLDVDGDLILDPATGITKFQLAGDADDLCTLTVSANGATQIETKDSDGTAGHLSLTPNGNLNVASDGHVEFDGCGVGFDLVTPVYNASDTNVDFLTGNKQFVTFGAGNITDLNLIFPKVSGNFTLVLRQDGTGSRLVTNWKAWDRAEGVAANGRPTVAFPGNTNPTLTQLGTGLILFHFFMMQI